MYGAAMNDIVQQIKITISGGKISYEDDISLSQAVHIIAFIDSSSGAANTPTSGVMNPIAFAPPPPKLIDAIPASMMTNPREALENSGAKTNPEKIVAFALYIGQEGAKDTFTLDDIKPLFRRTREPIPGNITRDLAAAIRAGWIADSGIKDEYYVTSKAAQVLETGFDSLRESRGNGAKGRVLAAKGSRKAAKSPKVIPDAFSGIDSISPKIDGYIDYHKLTKKTDKFLWAVNAAKLMGVETVGNQDIAWLTDRLGDAIGSGDIAGNFRQNHKQGYVNKSIQDNKMRITPAGEEYLKTLGSQ